MRCVAGSYLTALCLSPSPQLLSFLWPGSLTSPEPSIYSRPIRYSFVWVGNRILTLFLSITKNRVINSKKMFGRMVSNTSCISN